MRSDLLKVVSGHKDLTNVIILTFNIDLIYVENILLRALRQCGHPTLTIFADAEEVSRTFEAQRRWLSNIGRRFRVIPVPMSPRYRFHPKAVFLSGANEAELLVGSGNLTFGGFTQNDEIWTSFTTHEDGTGPLAAFREMLSVCIEKAAAGGGARREIDEAFDAATHSWATEMAQPTGLIWRLGEGPSLLEQVALVVGDRPIDRLQVCSPYYDMAGAGLREMASNWPNATIDLMVQPGKSTLTRDALDAAGFQPRLLSIKPLREGHGNPFIHAKFYVLLSGNEAILFAGSANCTSAALAQAGEKGNAELLAFRQMEIAVYQEQVAAEIEELDEVPEIPSRIETEEPDDTMASILILRASHDGSSLTMSFRASENVEVDTCWIDAEALKLPSSTTSGSSVTVPLTQAPRSIQLEGALKNERILSRSHWVDHEFALSVTSRQRKVAVAFEGKVSPTSWCFKSWTEIIRLMGDQVCYDPEMSPKRLGAHRGDEKTQERTYSVQDFFTADYRLPARRAPRVFGCEEDRIFGLQHLLLSYFGVELHMVHSSEDGENDLDDDEAVDRPKVHTDAPPPKRKVRKRQKKLNVAEQRRARRITTKLIDQLLREDFLRHRQENLLARDLTIIAVLLVAGQNEGWLSRDLFFELTYRAWTRLFFDHGLSDSEASGAAGWLELRTRQSPSPDSFREAVGTVPLSAALAMWVFSCPDPPSRAAKAQFALTTRMAVARLPWIWNLQRIEEVTDELDLIASRTGWLHDSPGRDWSELASLWNRMLAEGRALARLEETLHGRGVQQWSSAIEVDKVEAGDLLWQGRLGFCVVEESSVCRSNNETSVPVLLLRAKDRKASINSSFVLPVTRLLEVVLSEREGLDRKDVALLRTFLGQIEDLVRRPSNHMSPRN